MEDAPQGGPTPPPDSPPKNSKCFSMKPFKYRLVADHDYAEKAWKVLEHAINEIYNDNASSLVFDELYRHAFNLVLHKHGEKLYSGLVSTLTRRLKEMPSSIDVLGSYPFLETLNRKWVEHTKALQIIQLVLMYMDRTFVSSSCKAPVYELGLNLWRENVIHLINERLADTLLGLIQKERTGIVINRGLMKNITEMLMDLGSLVYQEVFEKPFLEDSAIFYNGAAQDFVQCCSCGEYLKKFERQLDEEMDRVSHYLDAQTGPKIICVVEKEMIANHVKSLVHMENSGLVDMLLHDKHEDLSRMYNLLRRVTEGLSTMRDLMTSHLRETGEKLVTDPERSKDPVDFVQRLLNAKDKYDKIISAFNSDKTFQKALNSSFEYFINLNSRSPEYISLYVDDKLCKGLKGVSQEDNVLDKVMVLFRYLHEKDVFEKYYRQDLAKRLLSGKTVSQYAEISLILRLRTQCGGQFTSNLQGMFTDMMTSQDTMQGFYASQASEGGEGGPALAVQVLTSVTWPIKPSAACEFPAEIVSVCEKFRAYYLQAHDSRRLTWQTQMGTADLRAIFGNGQKHELNVSTYQMCVLMLFNSADRLGCKEIEQATAIPLPDLKRCLQSLACVRRTNVLCKDPMSKDTAEDDIFSVNDKFTSKLFRVKIGTVAAAQEESEVERLENRQRVEEARNPQIEAAIVRIMKARQVLDHQSIVTEVTEQLQPDFLANPAAIKKRIERLIERDFLERDSDDWNLYRYLA